MNKTIKLFVTLTLLFASRSLFAADAFYIPVLGFGKTYVALFQGIVQIVGSAQYHQMISIFVMLGFFVILCRHAIATGNRGGVISPAFMFYLFVAITIFVGTNIKHPVQIDDLTSGKTFAVQDVPIAIGFLESFSHDMGKGMAELFEEAYTSKNKVPPELMMTGGAPFAVGPKLLNDASQYVLKDPYLKQSLTYLMLDCVVPKLASNRLSVSELHHSNNLWGLVKTVSQSPATMTLYYGTQESNPTNSPRVISCKDATQKLDAALGKSKADMKKNFADSTLSGLGGVMFDNALNYYAGKGPYSTTPGDYLMQAAMIDVYNNTLPQAAATQFDSKQIYQNLAINQARQNVFNSWEIEESTWASTFGYILIGVDLITIALAPLMLLFLFWGVLRKVVMSYLMLIMFVPMQMVAMSIASAIATHLSYGYVHDWFSGNIAKGLTLQSQVYISKMAIHGAQMGKMMLAISTVIGAGLCFGFTFVISRITGGLRSMADSAAQGETTGKVDLDQQSIDNRNEHAHNTAYRESIGQQPSQIYGTSGAIRQTMAFGGSNATLDSMPFMTAHSDQITTTHTRSGGTGSQNALTSSITQSDSQTHDATSSLTDSGTVSTSIQGKNLGALAVAGAYSHIDGILSSMGVNPDSISQETKHSVADQVGKADQLAVQAHEAQAQGHTDAAEGLWDEAKGIMGSAYDSIKKEVGDHPVAAAVIGVTAAAGMAAALAPEAVVGAVGAGAVMAGEGIAAAGSALTGLVGRMFGSRAAESAGEQFAARSSLGAMADGEAGGSIYTGMDEAEATAKPRFKYDYGTGKFERVPPNQREAQAEAAETASIKSGSGGSGYNWWKSGKDEESIAGKEGVNAGDGAGVAGGKGGSGRGGFGREVLRKGGWAAIGNIELDEDISGKTTGSSGISNKSSNTQKYDQGAQGRTTTDYKDQWARTETETTTTTYQTSPIGGSLVEGMPQGNQSYVERALSLAKASVARSNAGIDASGHAVSDQVVGDRGKTGDKVNERADNAIQLRKPKDA